MNGNGDGWTDESLASPDYFDVYAAPPSTYESTSPSFFGSLFQTVGDVAATAFKSVAAESGRIVTALVTEPKLSATPGGYPSFGIGQPALVGSRMPVGYPGSGSGGPTFIPFGEGAPTTFMAGLLSNPMMLAVGVGAILLVVFLVRR